jgi:aminoglycoside 3-N-acetyltransferase
MTATAQVTIRDADTTDLEGLTAIRFAAHPAIHRDRLGDAASNHLRFLIAEQGGTIVGFGLLVFSCPTRWSDSATIDLLPHIIDLYVAEDHRGRGIGTLIIQRMEELAASAGHDQLFISVDPQENARAHELYTRLGYRALQAKPHRDHWRYTDSDGFVHEGESWTIDLVKALEPRQPAPLTRQDIEQGLRALGLRRGDAIEVHSSLKSLGWVEGGASTVVDALMNVVGECGAIVMSAYAVSPPLPLTNEEKARGILAKVRLLGDDAHARSGMGAIADEFRNRPETVLGTGEYPVCAWGRNADRHSRGYRYLLDIDGDVLLLGVDIHRCSSMHIAESRVGIPGEITRLFEVPKDIRRDYPADLYYIECGRPPEDAWAKVQDEAERRGLIQRGRVGRAQCMLFRARAVVDIYEQFLRDDAFGLFGVEKGV